MIINNIFKSKIWPRNYVTLKLKKSISPVYWVLFSYISRIRKKIRWNFISFLGFLCLKKRKWIGKTDKNLSVLYVYAEKKRYPDSFKNLLEILDNIKHLKINIVRIDNFHENKQTKKIKGWKYNIYDIAGNNKDWEFSGWKKGLNFLEKKKIKADLLLFCNDAFLNYSKGGFDINYFKSAINTYALYLLRENRILGFVQASKLKETLMGNNVSLWIRSNIFVIPKKVVDKLIFPFMDNKVMNSICSKKYSGKLFNNTAPINNKFKRYLKWWLTKGWSRASELKKENWQFMRSKLKAILNERMLAAKMKEKNVRMKSIFNSFVKP